MLSSLSLFVCALVRGIFWRMYIYILAVKDGSFISVLRSCARVLFYHIFVCRVCPFVFFFFLFVDVFQSAMWSNLQAAVPRDDHHLRRG